MAATSWNPQYPRIVRPGGVPEIRDFKEGSTQSFKAGQPVKLNSGVLNVAADSAVGLLGIAQEDASGTASTMIAVQVIRPHIDQLYIRTTAAGTDALANTFTVGSAYEFYLNTSTGVFYADSTASAGATLIFVDYVRDANGDSTYWGIFELLAGQAGNLDAAGA